MLWVIVSGVQQPQVPPQEKSGYMIFWQLVGRIVRLISLPCVSYRSCERSPCSAIYLCSTVQIGTERTRPGSLATLRIFTTHFKNQYGLRNGRAWISWTLPSNVLLTKLRPSWTPPNPSLMKQNSWSATHGSERWRSWMQLTLYVVFFLDWSLTSFCMPEYCDHGPQRKYKCTWEPVYWFFWFSGYWRSIIGAHSGIPFISSSIFYRAHWTIFFSLLTLARILYHGTRYQNTTRTSSANTPKAHHCMVHSPISWLTSWYDAATGERKALKLDSILRTFNSNVIGTRLE